MAEAENPPANPDDWSDEEWIAWLNATDADGGVRRDSEDWPAPEVSLPEKLLGAAMKGMYRAIYGAQDDDVAEVQDASGDPPGDDPVELHLDPDHPEDTVVIVRPWLLDPPS